MGTGPGGQARRLELAGDDRRDLLLVTDYVADIHHLIDEDFFDIGLERLADARRNLQDADGPMLDYPRFIFLRYLIDAATEYSLRKSTGLAVDVPLDRLRALQDWLGAVEDELFRPKAGGPEPASDH